MHINAECMRQTCRFKTVAKKPFSYLGYIYVTFLHLLDWQKE